jgi:calcium-translocating P-type ATPase
LTPSKVIFWYQPGSLMKADSTRPATNAWHTKEKGVALQALRATAQGLSGSEAAERLARFGRNRLPLAQRRNAVLRFVMHFHNVLIYVLLASATVTAFLDHWVDTAVILAVVLANAAIGFIQEGKAENALRAISEMLAPKAVVMRDGERRTIEGELLVPGDIVLLEAGDRVPADLRLLDVHGLSIQEALLTGESVPTQKHIDPVANDAPVGDRACMAFSGTLVTSGQALGVVTGTAADTEIGRISHLLGQVEMLTTPLVRQISQFSRWLTIVILVLAFLLLVYGYLAQHHDFGDIIMAVIGLSVAAIPEGLPAVLTITLAVGVQSMARRQLIVRRLPALETLGSVSVICTDKTGTLTRNEMMVASVLTRQRMFTEVARVAALCNDAVVREHQGIWIVEGDPMEGALLAFSAKSGVLFQTERTRWTRTDSIPFDASHCFMATLHHDHEGRAFVFVKGAPEKILQMCSHQRAADGGIEPVERHYWLTQAESIAASGQRVLALAMRSVDPSHTVLQHADVNGTLTFLGAVGMIDPPRIEAIASVAECQGAGIVVKMITGDHAKTASAIGQQIGLKNYDKVLTGADIDKMSDEALKEAVMACDVFARTSPEHKLRLVMALQSHGMTVAMTGDGVNDAPALKRADVGVAMGKKGSETAREAAELVLADDNFSSIAAAVREGRTVYDNIKKVISWTLPTNAGEAMIVIVALLAGFTLPVTPIQILWINLVTGITLGLALAFEPTEKNTMRRPPRPVGEPLLDARLVWHLMLVSLLFLAGVYGIYFYAIDRGSSIELARTLSVNTLVVMEIFHLFFIRNIYGTSLSWKAMRGTRVVWLMVILVTIAQLMLTYTPQLQRVFKTEAVSLADGLIIMGIGILLLVMVEIEKQLRLRMSSQPAAVSP